MEIGLTNGNEIRAMQIAIQAIQHITGGAIDKTYDLDKKGNIKDAEIRLKANQTYINIRIGIHHQRMTLNALKEVANLLSRTNADLAGPPAVMDYGNEYLLVFAIKIER